VQQNPDTKRPRKLRSSDR